MDFTSSPSQVLLLSFYIDSATFSLRYKPGHKFHYFFFSPVFIEIQRALTPLNVTKGSNKLPLNRSLVVIKQPKNHVNLIQTEADGALNVDPNNSCSFHPTFVHVLEQHPPCITILHCRKQFCILSSERWWKRRVTGWSGASSYSKDNEVKTLEGKKQTVASHDRRVAQSADLNPVELLRL